MFLKNILVTAGCNLKVRMGQGLSFESAPSSVLL